MNAQEAARILAKENDSVVVVGIRREATGDLISDECFFNLDEFHAAVVCANLVGYILKIQKRKNSIDHILKGAYGDGILETTRKWNEAQREDKNV